MSISLDNINFCYQPPPPKPITTSCWKPYQVPPTPAHIPHRTCLLPPKPGVSVASTPTQSGASETAQSPRNSSGAAGSEPARIQADDGDSRKTVYHKIVAVEDISQKQSDKQASLSMQPATSESSESGATEQEVPESPRTTTLGLSEDSIEASQIPHQSGARSTPSICDILSARIFRSPSMGVPEDTLGLERAPQTENINIEERAVGDSQSQVATSYGAGDAGSKTSCTESLRYEGLGAEDRSAGRGGRDNRGHANPPTGQSCRVCCHPQANIRGLEQFASVSEKSPTRQPDCQVKTMTENTSSRTPYHSESCTDNWDSENGQAVDGLTKDYPTLTSRPIRKPNERQTKRSRRPAGVDFGAGCTSASSDNTTRGQSVPSQRRPDGNFPPTSSEAQEVFGRGILRIQPHGLRNAYIITFLPDVVETAPISSTSEFCEESSNSTGRGLINLANTSVADSVPGAQKHLPIDPLILADDGPWETGDLPQPLSLGDDPKPSEAIYPYPDPPPLFSSALDQRDSVGLRQGEGTRFTSSSNDCHSTTAGNPPSSNSPTSTHGGRPSKSRKRKPRRPDGQPPKRVRGSHTSAAEGDAFAALHTYFLSLPLDKRLQFLPWLLEDALPHHIPRPDLLTIGNGNARPASTLTPRSDNSESHGSSRKGMPYSPEEIGLLLRLKRDEKRPWSEVIKLFSEQFPGRSKGSIQVFFSTTLRKGDFNAV